MNWIFFFLALGILLWFIALLHLKSYIRRRTDHDYILGKLREEIALLEADIDTKTEQSLELLEDKITMLRELSTEAEKRIAVYTRELERNRGQESAFAALHQLNQPAPTPAPFPKAAPAKAPPFPKAAPAPKASKKPAGETPAGEKPKRARGKKLIDSIEVKEINLAKANNAYRFEVLRPDTARFPAAPPAAEEAADSAPRFIRSSNPISPKAAPMRERVAELHKAGFSEELIASRLGLSITEARLYIAMSKG